MTQWHGDQIGKRGRSHCHIPAYFVSCMLYLFKWISLSLSLSTSSGNEPGLGESTAQLEAVKAHPCWLSSACATTDLLCPWGTKFDLPLPRFRLHFGVAYCLCFRLYWPIWRLTRLTIKVRTRSRSYLILLLAAGGWSFLLSLPLLELHRNTFPVDFACPLGFPPTPLLWVAWCFASNNIRGSLVKLASPLSATTKMEYEFGSALKSTLVCRTSFCSLSGRNGVVYPIQDRIPISLLALKLHASLFIQNRWSTIRSRFSWASARVPGCFANSEALNASTFSGRALEPTCSSVAAVLSKTFGWVNPLRPCLWTSSRKIWTHWWMFSWLATRRADVGPIASVYNIDDLDGFTLVWTVPFP